MKFSSSSSQDETVWEPATILEAFKGLRSLYVMPTARQEHKGAKVRSKLESEGLPPGTTGLFQGRFQGRFRPPTEVTFLAGNSHDKTLQNLVAAIEKVAPHLTAENIMFSPWRIYNEANGTIIISYNPGFERGHG